MHFTHTGLLNNLGQLFCPYYTYVYAHTAYGDILLFYISIQNLCLYIVLVPKKSYVISGYLHRKSQLGKVAENLLYHVADLLFFPTHDSGNISKSAVSVVKQPSGIHLSE